MKELITRFLHWIRRDKKKECIAYDAKVCDGVSCRDCYFNETYFQEFKGGKK